MTATTTTQTASTDEHAELLALRAEVKALRKATAPKPKRAPRERETREYLQGMRRFMRGAMRRVGDADNIELADLMAAREEMDAMIALAVHGQRERGSSWADIAAATGVTRQAAQQRWGKRLPKIAADVVITSDLYGSRLEIVERPAGE
jgi:hypothetical protein